MTDNLSPLSYSQNLFSASGIPLLFYQETFLSVQIKGSRQPLRYGLHPTHAQHRYHIAVRSSLLYACATWSRRRSAMAVAFRGVSFRGQRSPFHQVKECSL